MANQAAIAKHLGLTQATVSMALRNHPRIPKVTRERVQKAAKDLAYRPNPSVLSLMASIRDGRSPHDHGCLGIIVDASSRDEWINDDSGTFADNLTGYQKEAEHYGYRVECFFLRAPNTTPESIDRSLRARGINGLLLAAPRMLHKWPTVNISWENYAIAEVGHSWLNPPANRISGHHLHNMRLAFNELVQKGYRRIGFCQPTPTAIHIVPSNWMAGYLMSQWEHPDLPKLEPFVGTVHDTTRESFEQWLKRSKPDCLITAIGDEIERIKAINITYKTKGKKGVSIACLNRSKNSPFAGIDENNELIGRKACNVLITQLIHNQFGPQENPDDILVKGRWVEEQ